MDTPREALRSKLASFAVLGRMKRCAAEEDDNDVADADGDGDARTREYAREQRDRDQRLRFFRPPWQLASESTSTGRGRDATAAKGARQAVMAVTTMETPRRVSSGSHGVIIAATQQHQSTVGAREEGRVGALLAGGAGCATDGETVIPDSAARPPTGKLPTTMTTADAQAAASSPSLQVGGAAAAARKRKRGGSAADPKLRPEREQVLRGLALYYIPNDDVAPARRLRIGKAREYGAAWTHSVAGATHVVVDKALEYRDVEKVLNAAAAAEGLGSSGGTRRPKVVNEDYPIDCIQFRALLDSGQSKYRVAGQPTEPRAEGEEDENGDKGPVPGKNVPPSSDESTRSLQVKAKRQDDPGKWDYVPPPGTPTRSEEPSHKDEAGTTTTPDDSHPVVLDLGRPARETTEEASVAAPHDGITGATKENDELSGYVAMMQEFKDLPLDHDDDEDNDNDETRSTAGNMTATSDSDEREASEEAADSRARGGKKARLRDKLKDTKFEDRFACNTAGELKASADNPNARTIEVLQSMADYYERINDHWRLTGYRKAIGTLKRQEVKVRTEEEAYRLPHIGRRLAQKIEEIATTDRLRRLEYAERGDDYDDDAVLQLFLGVYGVGTGQARRWMARGHRTLEDLWAQRATLLTASQRIGVEHHAELNARMPRREVEALAGVVRRAAAVVDREADIVVGGSYRRGAETCRDVDIIVTRPGTTSCAELRPLLDALVRRLEGEGFLMARLASSSSSNKDGGSKWHGCCALPLPLPTAQGASTDKTTTTTTTTTTGPWRRIDFLLVPESEMGGALLYFTGDDVFNRSMRLLASNKGMRLNQRGLFRDPHGAGGWTAGGGTGRTKKPPVGDGQLVEGRDERRIFEILGVRWREPHERWCR
ncbi:DNA-directed DNA polymerase [Purpureocillium takamizusanense]|uniref:DNA-directed DNA polymerase n=1 Tax=Purpureocillium takamizusanense TaxID=2060973 RepID=A0A9Q8V6J6_9HYPO|nr:DNA-directed DNA polymerase [Purpureocillium takamizusanense]UNI14960.1 DNA-directed DNA polymerase [Purpureocillium takamizusanense]